MRLSGTADTSAGKEVAPVNKDLRVSLAAFDAMESQPDIKPEQRDAISLARAKVKRFARIKNPTRADVFELTREISERLLSVLRKRQ